jgi:outer membrane receptor protein involved in Fe transport
MKLKQGLLLSSALCLISAALGAPALADDPAQVADNTKPKPAAAAKTSAEETIEVKGSKVGTQPGGGLIKVQTEPASISTISSDFIAKQPALTNPYQLIESVPGVTVGSSDPYGVQTPNLYIRGLDSTEIGFLWEGMPLNDVGNYLGYPDEWFATENLSQISVRQGSAGISDPLMNANGAVVDMEFIDPTDDPGLYADASYGSYHTTREFVRINLGKIGRTGLKGWISYHNIYAPSWHGPGYTAKQHVDFNFADEFDNGSKISLVGSWNHESQTFAILPTLADWNKYHDSQNYDTYYTNGDTNYWKLYQAPYTHFFMSAPSKFVVNDSLNFEVTPYLWYGQGLGSGGTVLPESGNTLGTEVFNQSLNVTTGQLPGGQFAAFATFGNDQTRPGVVVKANYQLGPQLITAGYWFDISHDKDFESFEALGQDGEPTNNTGYVDEIRLPNGQALFAQLIRTTTMTNAVFIEDKLKFLDDKLLIDAGFKEVMVSRYGTDYLPGPQYRTGITEAEPLPTLGVSYQTDPHNQFFASVATHFRVPVNLALYNDYYPPYGLYGVASKGLKAEYTISEEAGYRYNDDVFIGSATFFNYNFTNRQLASVVSQNGVQVDSYINAGGQTSRGVDAELGLRPIQHWSPYISAEYLNSHINNNILVGSDYLPTAGKVSVESPPYMFTAGASYDDSTFFGNVMVMYKASQYTAFMDDEKIPGYVQANMSLGYRIKQVAAAYHPEVKLNFINIGNVHYLSGPASITTNAQTEKGIYGTTISGTSPTYYVGGGFAAVISLSMSI